MNSRVLIVIIATLITATGCSSGKSSTPNPTIDKTPNDNTVVTNPDKEETPQILPLDPIDPNADVYAPTDLFNKVVQLTIEGVDFSATNNGYPEQGMFVTRYGEGVFVNNGLAPLSQSYASSYVYSVIDSETAKVESLTLAVDQRQATTDYMFDSPVSGTWIQSINDGEVVYHGSFTIENEYYPGLAPSSLAGKSADITFLTAVSNEPDGSYPKSGVATHMYNTSTSFSTDGSKVNVENTVGTYKAEKLSLNVIRDRGFNTTFNDNYEIVYTFETLTSGTFTEDWGNGAILWTGTFEMTDIAQ